MHQRLRDTIIAVAALTLSLALCVPAGGQVIKGSISGTVMDPQGAVLSGASIQARNTETGLVFTATSDKAGLYRLNLLPVGTYSVEITAAGFSKAENKSIGVTAGSDTSMGSVRLTVGESSTTVEVTAEKPLVESSEAQVTNTFTGTALNTFAGIQENQGLDRLALFVPGVVNSRQNNFSNTNGGVGFSVGGIRGRNNDQEIDGQNNNDNSVGGPSLQVSDTNFVEQYVLITNQFGPEYGRNAGSVVNVITKSGTNNWHGSLYGDETSSFLNALSNLQKSNGLTGPPRTNQEFGGGAIGGPIVKNKAFIFNGFDEQLFAGNTVFTSGTTSPTPAGLATLAGCSGINANALSFLTRFGPYGFSAGSPTAIPTGPGGTFRTTAVTPTCNVQVGAVTRTLSTPAHQFNWIERGDLQLGNNTISGRYIMRRNNTFNNNDNGAGGWVQNTTALSQSVLTSWTRNLSAHMVNEARVGFVRLNVQFGGNTIGNAFEPTDGNLTSALANVSFQNGGTLGIGPNTALPQGRIVNTWQLQDNWNYVVGKHALKAGVNWTYQRSPNIFLPDINGQFRFTTLSSFLTTDQPNRILIANGDPLVDFREYDTFLYVGDDWKISQNLTLNLGLTWTYYGQPENLFNSLTTKRESNPATAFWASSINGQSIPLSARTNPNIPTVRNSFGPSVGFAYSPQWGGFLTGHGKTVFRGGYRLLYDPPFYNIYLNISNSAPFVFLQTITGAQAAANPLLPVPVGNAVRAQLAPSLTPGVFDPRTFTQTIVSPNFGPDKVHSWSFGIERGITKNSAFEARYVGNSGTNLFQTVDGNPYVGTAAAPGLAQSFPNLVPAGVTACTAPGVVQTTAQAAAGPNPALGRANCNQGLVGSRNNGGYSNYQGLQLEFRANNLFKQLTVRTGYTWSKTLDNTSDIFATNVGGNTLTVAQNPFNTGSGEYSLSGLNVPNAWTLTFNERLPFFKEQHGAVGHILGGWEFSATYILASGQGYTPFQGGAEALQSTTFGNVYDSAFVGAFNGVDSARPFFGSKSAPIDSVGIFAGDACLFKNSGLFLGATAGVLNGACALPTGQLLSVNALNASNTLVSITNNQARYIVNARTSQQIFGTPFGNVPRNPAADAIQNTANATLSKTLKLGERAAFDFHITAVNALNHFNFIGVDPQLEHAGVTGLFGAAFGNPALSSNANGRQVFVGGRVTF